MTQLGACTFSVVPTQHTVTSAGGPATATVTAGPGCAWTASTNALWITISSGNSGSGNGTINYSVAVNPSTTQRSGTLTVAGQTITVTQTGACSYTVSPTAETVAGAGDTASTSVTTAAGCTWTATSNATWITISSGASGSGNGTVNYSVAPNPTAFQRLGTLTVAGRTVTVTQPGGCTITVAPTSQSMTGAGGTANVIVTTAAGCAWTATSNASWLTITNGSSGSGTGAVDYSVAANTTTVQRVGTLTVAGKIVTVTQTAASCTYTLTPTQQAIPISGGTATLTVTTQAGCTWTATTTDTWLTITGGSQGNGTGTVSYEASANTSTSQRVGALTVAGQNVPVTQAGATAPPPPTNVRIIH